MNGMKKMYSKTTVFFCLLLCVIFLAGWSLPVRAAGTESTRGEETEAAREEAEATRSAETETAQDEDTIDIDALSRELKSLEEEYEYPDFSGIFDALLDFRFPDAFEEAVTWLIETVTYEISTSWVFIGELIGVVIFAAVFWHISSSFRQFAIGDSGFLIAYFLTFTILFANFSIMGDLFSRTVETLSTA